MGYIHRKALLNIFLFFIFQKRFFSNLSKPPNRWDCPGRYLRRPFFVSQLFRALYGNYFRHLSSRHGHCLCLVNCVEITVDEVFSVSVSLVLSKVSGSDKL